MVLPWQKKCWFALIPRSAASNKPYWMNFGSSIVGSMYVVADYDENTIQIARARYSEEKAEIVPINHRSDHVL